MSGRWAGFGRSLVRVVKVCGLMGLGTTTVGLVAAFNLSFQHDASVRWQHLWETKDELMWWGGGLRFSRGGMSLRWFPSAVFPAPVAEDDLGFGWHTEFYRQPQYPGSPDWPSVLGFQVIWDNHMTGNRPPKLRAIIVPIPVAAVVTGYLPGVAMVRRYRRGRKGVVGLCVACGYDLRASPERCPECGREVALG